MRQKLNIAIISAFWTPSHMTGMGIFNNITAQLLKKQHTVTVITSDSPSVRYMRNIFSNPRIKDDEENKLMKIIRLQHKPLWAFYYYICYLGIKMPFVSLFVNKNTIDYYTQRFFGPQLDDHVIQNILIENKFDIIYLSSLPYFLNFQIAHIVKKNHLKTRIFIRPDYHDKLYCKNNKYYRFVLKTSHAIHTWTHAEKKQISIDYHINENKIKVLSPPIFRKKQIIGTGDFTIFKHKKIILYAGAKNDEKGVYRLIKAMQNVDAILITIGPHDFIWTLYKLFHKPPYLFDLGYVDIQTKENLFKICDIFCLPSLADSFCFAAYDAWKYKKPVVLGKTEVTEELINKIQGGVVVDTEDITKLSQVLTSLLLQKRYAYQIGEQGYDNMRKYYSEAINKNKYIQLFQQ